MVSFEEITSTLEERFDWYSARTTLRQALKAASLAEKTSYDAQEVEAIASVLPSIGVRVEGVVARLRGLSGDDAKAAPQKAAPAKEPAPEAAAPEAAAEDAAEAPVEAAPEAPVEDAVEDVAVEAESDEPSDEGAESGDGGDAKSRKSRRKK